MSDCQCEIKVTAGVNEENLELQVIEVSDGGVSAVNISTQEEDLINVNIDAADSNTVNVSIDDTPQTTEVVIYANEPSVKTVNGKDGYVTIDKNV